jgi:hypothetical protein
MSPDCAGETLRLLFHQRPDAPSLWKLNASNPGQFYYNVFRGGTPGDPVNLVITIPYPFVTQGAMPIHVYATYNVVKNDVGYCLIPGDQAPGFEIHTAGGTPSPSGAETIVIGDYTPPLESATTLVTVTGWMPDTGQLAVTIHLDYGLKRSANWSKLGGAALDLALGVTLDPCQTYTFAFLESNGGSRESKSANSVNEFKRNPGFGGLVHAPPALNDQPVSGVKIEAFTQSGLKIGESITDQDGAYLITYKHTGKAAYFWVKCPAYGKAQAVNIKANGFGFAEFVVP